jgi:tetratricopeptide (TPR) repeat protein
MKKGDSAVRVQKATEPLVNPHELGVSRLLAFACAFWASGCFIPTLGFDFVNWDDPLHVLENPLIRAPEAHGLSEHLLTPSLGYPAPVTVLSYRIEAALFGLSSAMPFHATNIVLHALIVGLVFGVGRRLGFGVAASSLAALVFGLHPVAAEPVSWVTGRKDLLAALFALLALWFSLKRRFDWRQAYSYGVLLLFALALLSKPVAGYLALVIPVWRWLGCRPAQRAGSRPDAGGTTPSSGLASVALEALPFVLLVLAIFPLAWLGQAQTHSLGSNAGLLEALRNLWFALGFHLKLLLGLTPTSCKYLVTPWPAPFTTSVDLLPLALAVPVAWLTRRPRGPARRRALAGLSFAGLAYLPNSNLIPLTRTLADVYVFMPLVGLAWWLAAVTEPLLARLKPRVLQGAVVAVAGVSLSVQTLYASSHFQNGVALWRNAYQNYPHDARLCRNLGNARFEVEGPGAALLEYTRCAERFGLPDFLKNIGLAQAALGNKKAARLALSRALEQNPNDPVVRKHLQRLAGD